MSEKKTTTKLTCGFCKQEVTILHVSTFEDQIFISNGVLEGKHKRIGSLCNQCWGDMMEAIVEKLHERQ